MYAETGIEFRFMQDCSPEIQQYQDLFKSYKLSDETTNLVEACEYDFGEESGLFKAPELTVEEPMLAVDPLSREIVELSDLGLDKGFYDCEHDVLVKSVMETPPLSKVLDIKNVSLVADMDMAQHEDAVIQRFFDLPPLDYGMRRAFSESDIQTLRTTKAGLVPSQLDRVIVTCISEDRREKLLDAGTRRPGGIWVVRSSMLAGRLLQTINRGSEEGLLKQRRCRNEDY